jgi:Protein of unknown function (DUF2794)
LQSNDMGQGDGPDRSSKNRCIFFDRHELGLILRVYGRMVAAGEWRDYAIDSLPDRCVFSVFRRASESPLYRIEKQPQLARRQGPYSVVAQHGQVLRRGHELALTLRIFEKGRFAVVT